MSVKPYVNLQYVDPAYQLRGSVSDLNNDS